MRLLIAALLATVVWVLAFVFTSARPGDLGHPVPGMALALCVPIFWLPTLVLLTLAAVLSRKRGRGVVVRIVLFYGLFALFTSSVLGLLYAAAPNPSNRDAGFAGIFQLLLIPTMLSSLIYPLIVLPRDNAASGIPNG